MRHLFAITVRFFFNYRRSEGNFAFLAQRSVRHTQSIFICQKRRCFREQSGKKRGWPELLIETPPLGSDAFDIPSSTRSHIHCCRRVLRLRSLKRHHHHHRVCTLPRLKVPCTAAIWMKAPQRMHTWFKLVRSCIFLISGAQQYISGLKDTLRPFFCSGKYLIIRAWEKIMSTSFLALIMLEFKVLNFASKFNWYFIKFRILWRNLVNFENISYIKW